MGSGELVERDRAIYATVKRGRSMTDVAVQFGIRPPQVSQIIRTFTEIEANDAEN